MVKDKYTFQLKLHFQGECELLTRTWKASVGTRSWSVDSSASLILHACYHPHLIRSTTSENTQSEALILRTILYLGLIL